jgi:hypothetical protein
MLGLRQTIVTVVLVFVGSMIGPVVCSAQTWGYGLYTDLAWSDGVVYGVAEGSDYADPPYVHSGQTLGSALYSPGGRSAFGTSDTALSFNEDFGTWSVQAEYGFNCSSDGWIEVETGSGLDLGYPPQSGGAPNPGGLAACLNSCAQGTSAIQNFCRSLPPYPPGLRAACWAVQFAGPAACDGFCYWWFT